MASTFLKLTNDVLRKLNEVELTETSFASARGIHAMAKDAVRDTVRAINTQKFEWPFNKADGQQVLTTGQEEYAWPDDFKMADWESFYVHNDGTLNTQTVNLKAISKEDYWRYLRPDDLDAGSDGISVPQYVYAASGIVGDSDPITRTGGFGVSPSPDAGYTVKYTYFINTIDLEDYDDETTIPTLYDHVILVGALEHMYAFMDNSQRSVMEKATFKDLLANMAFMLIPKTSEMTAGQMNPGQHRYIKTFDGR